MTNFIKLILVFLTIGAFSTFGIAQPKQQESNDCMLSTYQSGQQIILDGIVRSGDNGTFLSINGCKYPVVIQYPSNLLDNEKQGIPEVHKDANLDSLNSQLRGNSTKPVEASLFGRLDIAKPVPEGATTRMGYVFDKSGKNIGTYGFGSPVPIYKYRLVLIQVNSVSSNPSK